MAENAKIQNMEQRFTTELALKAALAAMGLTELNTRLLNTMIARIVTSKRLVMTKSANMTCLDD